jgi:hypothetical protein
MHFSDNRDRLQHRTSASAKDRSFVLKSCVEESYIAIEHRDLEYGGSAASLLNTRSSDVLQSMEQSGDLEYPTIRFKSKT